MGNCCCGDSSSKKNGDRGSAYAKPKQTQMGQWSPSTPPKPQAAPQSNKAKQQHREMHWKATGIVGMRDQGVSHLPASVADVGTDAKVLDATNNKLHELPPVVSQLPNLQRIVLCHNSIFTVAGPPLRCLPALKVLLLDHNKISELPEEVSWLTRLEKLSITHNTLTGLPAGLASCTKLTCILASHNRMKMLPPSEKLPPQLEEFNASHNQISAIPPSWGSLKDLKILNLDANHVSDVPVEVLQDCSALQTLCLHSNPIVPAQLQANPGYVAFEERRKSKYDKAIAGGVLMGAKNLDEGIDRKVTR